MVRADSKYGSSYKQAKTAKERKRIYDLALAEWTELHRLAKGKHDTETR